MIMIINDTSVFMHFPKFFCDNNGDFILVQINPKLLIQYNSNLHSTWAPSVAIDPPPANLPNWKLLLSLLTPA